VYMTEAIAERMEKGVFVPSGKYHGNTILSRFVHRSSHSIAMLRFSSSPPLSEIHPLCLCFSTGPFVLLVSSSVVFVEVVSVFTSRVSLAVPEIFAFWSPERREKDPHLCQRFLRCSLIASRAKYSSMRPF